MSFLKVALCAVICMAMLSNAAAKPRFSSNHLAQVLIGHIWRFRVHQGHLHHYYIHHSGHVIKIVHADHSARYKAHTKWRIVRGLCGYGISFQAYNKPHFYLRHSGYVARLDRYHNSRTYKLDACFIPHVGLASSSEVSFESANFRHFYLRHYSYWVRIDRFHNSAGYRNDATFQPWYAGDH